MSIMTAHRQYDIRCPIHGFIGLNDWEREIISQPPFQRLRRIRQLAWTDQVYPGAMHTRFEHSLGVMHTATMLFDAIGRNAPAVLSAELAYTEAGLQRHRQLVRFAALLHDIGHSPFSHASEELFPEDEEGTRFSHEQYSAAIVRTHLRDAIENHPLNRNHDLSVEDVAALIEGSAAAKQSLFWRDLITGQMDADRMDYLLRDSHHIGVHYGRYDLNRLVTTLTAIPGSEGAPPRLGLHEGGWHAAEALVLARYFMFTQVYFHKTRVAYDVHVRGAMKALLPGGHFPRPIGDELDDFLKWDDWRVLGLLANGDGGEHGNHGNRIACRNHFRMVYHTPEVCSARDFARLENVKRKLGDLLAADEPASKSWYKKGIADIPILSDIRQNEVLPLSRYSKAIERMQGNNETFLYVRPEQRDEARKRIERFLH